MTTVRTWETESPPEVGTLGGECFRAFCHTTGANWYHRKAGHYYCERCATALNEEAWFKGEPPACSRHR